MKNSIALGKILTRDEMKKIIGGTASFEFQCGTHICSRYESCCSYENASGQIVYYCTTTACL
jgi:hypothetical protein